MKKLEPGFPNFKSPKKKTGYIKKMSDKTKEKMPIRKQVIDETRQRAGGKCETAWIAPHVPCNNIRHTDEKFTRGRSGGTSQYSTEHTQSICSRCDFCKENEVKASEILGLYGEQGKRKHIPITEQQIQQAKETFALAKGRLNF